MDDLGEYFLLANRKFAVFLQRPAHENIVLVVEHRTGTTHLQLVESVGIEPDFRSLPVVHECPQMFATGSHGPAAETSETLRTEITSRRFAIRTI
jgi:hypothetical protein